MRSRSAPWSACRPRPGLTLVELLVVLVLMVIVTGAGFTLFQIGARHEMRQQDVLNQTQNLRAALYTIARDVRMAGNGLNFLGSRLVDIYADVYAPPEWPNPSSPLSPGWFRYRGASKYGARAIFGTDGAAGQPDTLTVFRAEIENPLPLGYLRNNFTPGTDMILALRSAVKEGENITDGDIVAVVAGERAVILQAELYAGVSTRDLRLGPRFRPGSEMPGGSFTFPEGATVFNLRDVALVTYYLDRDEVGGTYNRLMANYHDGTVKVPDEGLTGQPGLVAVTGNIEDFQVAYFIDTPSAPGPPLDADGILDGLTPTINEAALDGDRNVRVVRLGLGSRSSRGSEVAGTADRYTRRALSSNISLRNFN